MRKFINPEISMVRFDVENIITTSGQGSNVTAEDVAKQTIEANGININGTDYDSVDTLTILF